MDGLIHECPTLSSDSLDSPLLLLSFSSPLPQGDSQSVLEARVNQLQLELSHLQGLGKSQGREVTSLQQQLEGARGELEAMRRENQTLSQRSSQLRDDLNTMTQVYKSCTNFIITLFPYPSYLSVACSMVR